jgi:hypothetical protein
MNNGHKHVGRECEVGSVKFEAEELVTSNFKLETWNKGGPHAI